MGFKGWDGPLDDFNPDEFCDNDDETCCPSMILDNYEGSELLAREEENELAI